jgi:hypothetical protein
LSLFGDTEILDDFKGEISVATSAVTVVVAWSQDVGAFKNELFWKVFFSFSPDHHESFVESDSGESPTGATAALVLDLAGFWSIIWRGADFIEAGFDDRDLRAGISFTLGSFGTEESWKDKLEITLVLIIKKISKLVDRVSAGIVVGVEILYILKGPAELGEFVLIDFRSEIWSFAKINSVLIVALSGASVVSRGEGQKCDQGNGEDTSVH